MRDTTTRVLLVIVGAGNALVGLWASLAPHSFYDSFPGSGRHWVSVDGPFNEHLVRDVGTLNLALAAIAVAALLRPLHYLVLVFAGAELLYTAPHFLYHAAHLEGYEGVDQIGLMVTLGVSVLAPILLLLLSSRVSGESMRTHADALASSGRGARRPDVA